MSLIKRYIGLVWLGLICLPVIAQHELTPEEQQYNLRMQTEIRTQLNRLLSDLNQLADDEQKQGRISERDLHSTYYVHSLEAKVQSLTRRVQAFEVRWDAFNASNLPFIADDESLMEQMTQAQLLKQAVTDTLTAQQNRCTAIKDFLSAEDFITAQDSIYEKLYKQAFAMSFVQKMEPQLEKLKAQEQVQFTEIQSQYDKAKAASGLVPQLDKKATALNDRFFSIKAQSDKIQQLKYEPIIQRIKDYLMGIAYVAVILIFVNMIISKWQAAKKTKQAVEQQAEMLKKEHDYPTI